GLLLATFAAMALAATMSPLEVVFAVAAALLFRSLAGTTGELGALAVLFVLPSGMVPLAVVLLFFAVLRRLRLLPVIAAAAGAGFCAAAALGIPTACASPALGVTRVARVTGLDRAGVEVACAVRPGGHVLQVTNGKGESWEEARAAALSEAAELWAAEQAPSPLHFAAARELEPRAWLDAAEVAAPRLLSSGLRIAWIAARDLISGTEVLVPAQAVHCLPPGSASLGPGAFRWSSNGMGSHPQRSLALLHAILEAAERDRLASALPLGWNPAAIRSRKLAERTLPPRTSA